MGTAGLAIATNAAAALFGLALWAHRVSTSRRERQEAAAKRRL